MSNFNIENRVPSKIQKSGRKPSSEEYEIGTKIYNEFKIGNCSFFPSSIKYKALLSRLHRLNEQNGTSYEYTVRKDNQLGEKVNIGYGHEVRELIEGFRIYRVK
jgi:hypothetical protein